MKHRFGRGRSLAGVSGRASAKEERQREADV
jgi:hypothetical protein